MNLVAQDEWVEVGSVVVDSGRCLLLDPEFQMEKSIGMYELVNAVHESKLGSAGPLRTRQGIVVGLVVGTGERNGDFPVEVRYDTDEVGTRRIVELRVSFTRPAR